MKKLIALLMATIMVLCIPVVFAEDVAAENTETTEAPAETVTAEDAAVEEIVTGEAVADETIAEDAVEEISDSVEEAVIEEAVEEAGITPDSVLYPIETAIDDIHLALTTDEADKAELAVEIADERLAETVVMTEEGDLEAAAEAQEQHDEAIAEAEEAVEAIETDGDVEEAQEALETVARVQARIEGHAAKVAFVKDTILARMAEKKTPEQLAHMQAVFEKIKAKAVEMETKADSKKERVKTKYKALAKKTDAEVEAEVEEIDEQAGLREAKTRAEKALRARAEKIKANTNKAKSK